MSTTLQIRRPAPALQQTVALDQAVEAVAKALGALNYGAVQLTIHDGRVVQMDVTARHRFG